MKLLVAPDKLKGSLSSFDFCKAIVEGVWEVRPDIVILQFPLADGGEGLVEILHHYLKGQLINTTVNDPLFRKIKAHYGISEDSKTAYIEMATASGLYLLRKEEQNCYCTSTFGTGELILHAIGQGIEEIILGIGGSATNDAGMGMASALGYQFLDKNKQELKPIGKNLIHIETIDDSQLRFDKSKISVKIACDVSNPLYGKNGAAYIYAKQKGATNKQIVILDRGLKHFAKKVMQKYMGLQIEDVPGAGAAGGMGAAGIVFLNADLISGTKLILEKSQIKKYIADADLVITGEGKLDNQTTFGKAVNGISTLCKSYEKKLVGICGQSELTKEEKQSLGLNNIYQIIDIADNEKDAMKNAYVYVKKIVQKLVHEQCGNSPSLNTN